VIQTLEAQVGQFLLGCKCPVSHFLPGRAKDFSAGGSPTGPDPENRVGDQDVGSPGRPVSSGFQAPGEPFLPGRNKDLSAPL
jgi:hypothetical protein